MGHRPKSTRCCVWIHACSKACRRPVRTDSSFAWSITLIKKDKGILRLRPAPVRTVYTSSAPEGPDVTHYGTRYYLLVLD